MIRSAFALLLFSILAFPAQAAEKRVGDLMVGHAWARASAGTKARNGAAYITVHNLGSEVDRLLAVATPVAGKAQFHDHIMKDGIMRMTRVKAVEVAPGEPTVFRPGGLHVMLMKLKAPLQKGGEFALTLTFEKAGKVEIMVPIMGVGAMGGHRHDDMHKDKDHKHDKQHKMHHGSKTDS